MTAAGDRGPWRTLASREVYRNPWIRLREDDVLRPNGSPGIYGYLETGPALGIVALTDAEDVHLVGQYRYATDEYSWEIPTGTGDPGEDLLAGAQRELREETGLRAETWTPLGRVQISNSLTDQIGHVYLARGLTPGPAEPDETEELATWTVPLAEAVRDAQRGTLSQAFSVVGLYRAWHHLRGDLGGS